MKIRFNWNCFRGIFNNAGGHLDVTPHIRIIVNRDYYGYNRVKLRDIGVHFNWIVFHCWVSIELR